MSEYLKEIERERKPIIYSPDAQAMSDRVKAAEAERDALRAELSSAEYLLQEARDRLDTPENAALVLAIDVRLNKGDGDAR